MTRAAYIKGTPEERFWPKVKRGRGCWIWTAAKDRKGYGIFALAPGKRVRAHRFAWEQEHGPLPAGACLLHRCDNPACVRPAHLFVGSREDNNADMDAKGRAWYQRYSEDQRARRRKAWRKRKRTRIRCGHCGHSFWTAHPRVAKWCSPRCESRARRERQRTAKTFGMSEQGAEALIRQADAAGPRPDGTIVDT